jgi:uncharacterized protein
MAANRFAQLAFTEHVQAEQSRAGSRAAYARQMAGQTIHDRLGPDEVDFIQAQDHFLIATVGETGYPYVQHRGGRRGLLHVLDERTVAFAEVRGNRQYITVGNLRTNDRVSVLLLDQAAQARLKLLGRARVVEAAEDRKLLVKLAPTAEGRVERAIVIQVGAFDWNCPQHIVPRYTAEEIEAAVEPLRARIRELEERLEGRASGPG